MKAFFYLLRLNPILLCVSIIGLFIASCDKNEDKYVPEYLLGTWTGQSHESRGTAYLSVTFNADLTGEYNLETPSGAYSYAYFTYTVSGNEVICRGAEASSIGGESLSDDWVQTFRLEDDKLYPTHHHEQFILTKDGSVETDSNGEPVTDRSDLLQSVWINESGESILHFKNGEEGIEYTLSEPYSDTAVWAVSFDYFYDYRRGELDLYFVNGDFYYCEISQLDEESLVLKIKGTNRILKYKRGTNSDLPTELDFLS